MPFFGRKEREMVYYERIMIDTIHDIIYNKDINTGSSHCTFRKEECMPITIPKHKPIKKVYIEMVREIVESEAGSSENN